MSLNDYTKAAVDRVYDHVESLTRPQMQHYFIKYFIVLMIYITQFFCIR